MQTDEFKIEVEKLEEVISKKYGNFADNINSENVIEYCYKPLKDIAKYLICAEFITLYLNKILSKLDKQVFLKNENDILKIHNATEKLNVLLDCLLDRISDIFINE